MPPLEVEADEGAELLVLGWGSTYGVVQAAARRVREREIPIATAHLRHLDPLPRNTGDVVRSFSKVLIPEMNTGQLLGMIRGKFLVDAVGYNKVEGLPIFAEELEGAILEVHWHERERGQRERHPADADQAGLPVRPGDALVPGLRRLRDPRQRPGADARTGRAARENGLHLRRSAAPGASSTTWTPTGCTASTAGRRRWRPGSRPPATTSRSGWSAATATRSRSAATT